MHDHGFSQKSSLQNHLINHQRFERATPSFFPKVSQCGLEEISGTPFHVHSATNLLICLECEQGVEIKSQDSSNPGLAHLRRHHNRIDSDRVMDSIKDRIGAGLIYKSGWTG